ncbi:hypothetical protein [Chlorobaculum limnaeum]|nr:hypothetical protein [Chlorobaculum limnaeum]
MHDDVDLCTAMLTDRLLAIVPIFALSFSFINNSTPSFGMGKLADFLRSRAASGA